MSKDPIIDSHILNILQNHPIEEQSELQELLKVRGFDVPQATLSRRLKKLKIAKVEGLYKAISAPTSHLPLILNIGVSEFGMIVLHTAPSNANSIALFIDQKYVSYSAKEPKNSGILGTLAGDDTILIIPQSKAAVAKILDILKSEFDYLQIPSLPDLG